jgi:hypothetical protein
MLLSAPLFGAWVKENKSIPVFSDRFQLYDYLLIEVICGEPITYLEFGVYKGESLRYWAQHIRHENATFFGFDTFEGLPEAWHFGGGLGQQKGAFDLRGVPPEINDKRVGLVKGLFSDTLPVFMQSQKLKNRTIVNIDCDLYSSTLFVLTKLDEILAPRSIIIFDEFNYVMDEFRAFQDYSKSYNREFRAIAATRNYRQVAFLAA